MNGKNLTAKIYTDGSCSKEQRKGFGPGGWSAILLISSETGREKIILKGGELNTTSNRMELKAAVEALRFLSDNFKGREIVSQIITDSNYAIDILHDVKSNIMNGAYFMFDDGHPDLKCILGNVFYNNTIDVKTFKVKSHNGDKYNELADKIAVEQRKEHYNLLRYI